MTKFAMTWGCGHTVLTEAETRDDAVTNLKAQTTLGWLDEHFLVEQHEQTDLKPTLEQALAAIEVGVAAAPLVPVPDEP